MQEFTNNTSNLKQEIELIRSQFLPKKRIFWPDNIRVQILELYKSGWSVNKLQAELKISCYTIDNWIAASAGKKKVVNNVFKEVKVSAAPISSVPTNLMRVVFELGGLHITIESKSKSELRAFLNKAI